MKNYKWFALFGIFVTFGVGYSVGVDHYMAVGDTITLSTTCSDAGDCDSDCDSVTDEASLRITWSALSSDGGAGTFSGTNPTESGNSITWQATSLGNVTITATCDDAGDQDGTVNDDPSVSTTIDILVVPLDVDVDSDNNNGFSSPDMNYSEDSIENDPSLPGKIVVVNDNDNDYDGIPDFADGFNLHFGSDDNSNEREKMTPIFIKTGPFSLFDPDIAKIRLTYSDSYPTRVTRSGSSGSYTYQPDPGDGALSSRPAPRVLRLWKQVGDSNGARDSDDIKDGGDFIPQGVYTLNELGIDSNGCTLWVEAIQEDSNAQIVVELDIEGDGTYEISDTIHISAIEVRRIVTDITGFHGIGATTAQNVPHVPYNQEPDGIACDGLAGVDDGAQLLVRVAVPSFLDAASISALSSDFGYFDDTDSFASLPSSGNEGVFDTVNAADITALNGLGIATDGQVCEFDNTKIVVGITKYKPPIEVDLDNPANITDERFLKLAGRVQIYGGYLAEVNKNLMLVRTPVVLIHGINSDAGMWYVPFNAGGEDLGYVDRLKSQGFYVGCIQHSQEVGKDAISPYYAGNGDVHFSSSLVMEDIRGVIESFIDDDPLPGYEPWPGNEAVEARIAIQKLDVVAHSYGGVLTRWYTEQLLDNQNHSEYEQRCDVRKVITLGTPHKGAPICNIMAEARDNPVIRGSYSGVMTVGLEYILDQMHDSNTVKWYDDNDTDSVVPALQVLALNSECLTQLNSYPFRDEIAYGSVVGYKTSIFDLMDIGIIYPYNDHLVPTYKSDTGFWERPYTPWVHGLEPASDAIVPRWSQVLPSRASLFDVNHISYNKNIDVLNTTKEWLNDSTLETGDVHRPSFLDPTLCYNSIKDQLSRINAYQGSTIGQGNLSSGAGFMPDAIVQTILSYPAGNPDSNWDNTIPQEGGIVTVTCTGMVQDTRTLAVVADGLPDVRLHENITIPYEYSIPNSPTPTGELVTFKVEGYLGKNKYGDIRGKDRGYSNGESYSIAYKMDGDEYANWDAMESPPSILKTTYTESDVLKPDVISGPSTVGSAGADFTATGVVATTANGAFQLKILDADTWPNDDDTLWYVSILLTEPPHVFDGVLVPYSIGFNLYKNTSGHVAGDSGSSDQSTAEVYQEIECDIGTLKSDKTDIAVN